MIHRKIGFSGRVASQIFLVAILATLFSESVFAASTYVYVRVCNEGELDVSVAVATSQNRKNMSSGWTNVAVGKCKQVTKSWNFALAFLANVDGNRANISLDKDKKEIIYDDGTSYTGGYTSGYSWGNSNGFTCVQEDFEGFRTEFTSWEAGAQCAKGFIRFPLSNWVKPKMLELWDSGVTVNDTYLDLKIKPRKSGAQTFSGSGVRNFTNSRYEGELRAGMPHGRGVLIFPSGERYEGDFKNGLLDGQASLVWASGDQFKGQFKNGQKNGHGVFTKANGDKCEGEWRDDKLVGTGKGMQNGVRKACYPEGTQFTF